MPGGRMRMALLTLSATLSFCARPARASTEVFSDVFAAAVCGGLATLVPPLRGGIWAGPALTSDRSGVALGIELRPFDAVGFDLNLRTFSGLELLETRLVFPLLTHRFGRGWREGAFGLDARVGYGYVMGGRNFLAPTFAATLRAELRVVGLRLETAIAPGLFEPDVPTVPTLMLALVVRPGELLPAIFGAPEDRVEGLFD